MACILPKNIGPLKDVGLHYKRFGKYSRCEERTCVCDPPKISRKTAPTEKVGLASTQLSKSRCNTNAEYPVLPRLQSIFGRDRLQGAIFRKILLPTV
jgi:hypothetical protein